MGDSGIHIAWADPDAGRPKIILGIDHDYWSSFLVFALFLEIPDHARDVAAKFSEEDALADRFTGVLVSAPPNFGHKN